MKVGDVYLGDCDARIGSKNGSGTIYFNRRPPIIDKIDGVGSIKRFK